MAKVRDVMITDFQTGTIDSAGSRAGGFARAEPLVVTADNGQPVSLLPAGQVDFQREGEGARLPVVPVVEEDADLNETVRELAPQLLERQELAGAVVLRGGEIRGILPRALIAEHARLLLAVQGRRGLDGDPQIQRPVYACPQGDYEDPVSYYNPFNPPRCPNHGDLLVRKA